MRINAQVSADYVRLCKLEDRTPSGMAFRLMRAWTEEASVREAVAKAVVARAERDMKEEA